MCIFWTQSLLIFFRKENVDLNNCCYHIEYRLLKHVYICKGNHVSYCWTRSTCLHSRFIITYMCTYLSILLYSFLFLSISNPTRFFPLVPLIKLPPHCMLITNSNNVFFLRSLKSRNSLHLKSISIVVVHKFIFYEVFKLWSFSQVFVQITGVLVEEICVTEERFRRYLSYFYVVWQIIEDRQVI